MFQFGCWWSSISEGLWESQAAKEIGGAIAGVLGMSGDYLLEGLAPDLDEAIAARCLSGQMIDTISLPPTGSRFSGDSFQFGSHRPW